MNFILIFTVYLFFLLKFYPGILTFDSYNELSQVQGILPLMNNHSILHTEVLMIFYIILKNLMKNMKILKRKKLKKLLKSILKK